MVGLRRAEKDLARLQKNVDTRVEALQRELGERHAAFTVPSARLQLSQSAQHVLCCTHNTRTLSPLLLQSASLQ